VRTRPYEGIYMRKTFVVAGIAASIMAAGCTSPVDRWIRTGGSDVDFDTTRSQCQARTEQPVGNSGDVVSDARKLELYETCMRGQGYWNDAKRMKR
jgi:hypothetical protein